MYAIISDGGHQYRVEEGLTFELERTDVPGDGKTIEFPDVLTIGDIEDGPRIGQPTVEGAKVVASVLEEVKGDKIVVQKFRRRKGYARKQGHRQKYLRVKVDKIEY